MFELQWTLFVACHTNILCCKLGVISLLTKRLYVTQKQPESINDLRRQRVVQWTANASSGADMISLDETNWISKVPWEMSFACFSQIKAFASFNLAFRLLFSSWNFQFIEYPEQICNFNQISLNFIRKIPKLLIEFRRYHFSACRHHNIVK